MTKQLKIAYEDGEEMLEGIAASFNIKFEDREFEGIRRYGAFRDKIMCHLELDDCGDCTSQQAFYRLRESISETLNIEKREILPETKLKDLFPRNDRRARVREVERKLGFSLGLLRSPHFITIALLITFIFSLIWIFANPVYGSLLLLLTLISFKLSDFLANCLDINSMRELVEKVTIEQYTKVRRNPGTLNRSEIDGIIKGWLVEYTGVEISELKEETKLVFV